MKGALALQLCLAVFAAFCDAPFVHIHLDGDTDHARQAHQGKGFDDHTHGAHASRTHEGAVELVAAEGSDEDAVFLTWFQSSPQPEPTAVAALPTFTAVIAPSLAAVTSVAVLVPRSHDPPCCPSLRPRSPPPIESLPAA
jgi:hypothetical protein